MHVSWRLESASVRRIDRIIVDGNCQGLDVVLDSMEVIALKTTEWGRKVYRLDLGLDLMEEMTIESTEWGKVSFSLSEARRFGIIVEVTN